jgi:hypothetical protein
MRRNCSRNGGETRVGKKKARTTGKKTTGELVSSSIKKDNKREREGDRQEEVQE